jgi:pectate lyase
LIKRWGTNLDSFVEHPSSPFTQRLIRSANVSTSRAIVSHRDQPTAFVKQSANHHMREKHTTLATVAAGVCLLCAFSTTAQNLIVNGDFGTGDLTGWTLTPAAPTTITYDIGTGNPSGAAALARNDSTATANGNYLYQIIPVVNGQQYQLSAQWKGDLLNGGTGRNWAEVYINFTATNTPFVPGTIRYKKATDGGPNQIPMPWDWESITTSPDGSNPGPADGVFTATGNYMTLAFNLGGRAQTSNNTQPGYYWVDNVSVSPYPPVSSPVFTSAMQSGGDIILQGTNGPANGAYQMLRSTNVTVPVGDWQGVGIRPFDVNGNFSFTNPIVSDFAEAFYRLLVVSSVPVFPPVITSPPQNAAIAVGQNAAFNVTATGTEPLTYRWYFNTNTLVASGSSASLTISNAQLADSGKISVTVSNLLGSAQSTFATLTVTNNTQPPVILAQPANQNLNVGQTANFSVTASGALPLQYQWYHNTNTVLNGQTNSTLTLLNVQTSQAGKYSVSVTNLFGTTNSIFATLTVSTNSSAVAIPDGYATQNGGTTGGGNATPLIVSTAAAFQSAVNNNTPAVIIVNGILTVGTVSIGSNKTIMGANTNSGLTGGTIRVQGSNYIFQNLTIGPASGDTFEISGARNVFVTKCEFYGSTDELCSIVRAADFVTVSWSKFHFPNSDSHSFAHLIGNGDDVFTDRDKLHVTLHHNWYTEGVEGRMPRVRFGHVHIYNNFFNSVGNGYCIGIGVECNIRVENSHFESINNAWADYGGTSNGELGWSGLKFVNCSQPTFMPNTFPVFTPPYPYSMDPVDNVKALVMAGAGNVMTP